MAKTATPKTPATAADTMAGAGHHYAVVVDGGRQYTVREGQELEIDFRHLPVGGEVLFKEVLAVSKAGRLTLGTPLVKGASVKAEVLGLVQGDKLFVQKFRRRKNYRRRTGHRSLATKIRIASIA
jgi:large subunit ribosomal protein L21